MNTILLLLLLVVPGVAVACESDLLEGAREGKRLFNGKAVCFGCHGTNADGRTNVTPDIDKFNPKPTDLRNPAALRFTFPADRYDVIRDGIPGTGMVPFRGTLYDQQIVQLVEYLEVLRKGGC